MCITNSSCTRKFCDARGSPNYRTAVSSATWLRCYHAVDLLRKRKTAFGHYWLEWHCMGLVFALGTKSRNSFSCDKKSFSSGCSSYLPKTEIGEPQTPRCLSSHLP
jgi:hypothetical protein